MTEHHQYKERPRHAVTAWLCALSAVTGDMRAAEGHMLELLAWCAFTLDPQMRVEVPHA